ncbi:MAG TPA: protein-glutamate O-methyltransferase CheR [Syntrophorhabdales bacterium]|nr:protein-glutamate O-methyltransferase CheR [Syntrophorhabdales bacterium]
MQPETSLTDTEFVALRDFIYQKTGILFTERTRYLLDSRTREIFHQTNCKDALSYLKSLHDPQCSATEMNRLINKVTITETSFFRDPHQMSALAKNVIPELAKRHDQLGSKLLRIWSAGSSSGEEAYTVAILLAEHFKEHLGAWNITIFATDINEDALQACKTGAYKPYTLRNTPREIQQKYFHATSDEKFVIRDDIKKLVVAERSNLTDPGACKKYWGADLILLRNVLIYFDATVKTAVLQTCYENLRDNGYLFLGQSETVFSINHSFKLVTFVNAFGYKKVPPR